MLIQCSCNKCSAGASDMSYHVTRPLRERTDLIREVKTDFPDVRGKTEKMTRSQLQEGERESHSRERGRHMQRSWAGQKGAYQALGSQREAAEEGKWDYFSCY